MKAPYPWIGSDDTMLLSLRSRGFTFPDIADLLNRSPRSCNVRWLELQARERRANAAPAVIVR